MSARAGAPLQSRRAERVEILRTYNLPKARSGIQSTTTIGGLWEGALRVAHAAFEERAQTMAPAGMPQLAQCLGFDLADTLARDREVLPHFLERVLAAIFQAEAHLDDLL